MVRRRRPGTYYPYCWYDAPRVVASTAEDAATIHYDSAKLVEEAEEYVSLAHTAEVGVDRRT